MLYKIIKAGNTVKEFMMKKTVFKAGVVGVLILILALTTGCGGGSVSLEKLPEKLSKLKVNTVDKPYNIMLDANVNIGTKLGEISRVVESEGKFVILDISVCGINDNRLPDMSSISHNTYIVGFVLPKSITTIDDQAFERFNHNLSITIPASVNSIGRRAFSDANITVASGNNFFKTIDGILLDKNETTLIFFPRNRSGSYSVPNGVKIIGSEAFSYTDLTSLSIPASVTSIENYALDSTYIDGSGLKEITFAAGSNITSFGTFWITTSRHGTGDASLKRAYEAETLPLATVVTFVRTENDPWMRK